jgi:hypothetical protein
MQRVDTQAQGALLMTFTKDEIQALNTIVEQKLAQQRLELEHSFEQHILYLRNALEQQLAQQHQDILRILTQGQTEQQQTIGETVIKNLEKLQPHLSQRLSHEIMVRQHHHQQQMESLIERTLAAHLLAVEQLLQQTHRPAQQTGPLQEHESQPGFEAIEVQTELPWEDFVDVIGKVLDERISVLDNSLRTAVANLEHYVSARLHEIRDDLTQEQLHTYNPDLASMHHTINLQELFTGLQQLEHLIESMQVAMTANHAMLSNRLYHHQHLPLERAHPPTMEQHTTEHPSPGQVFLKEHDE